MTARPLSLPGEMARSRAWARTVSLLALVASDLLALVERSDADGDDLITAGYQPGPEFSKILRTIEDAQLEGRITTAGEAMALVREMFGG